MEEDRKYIKSVLDETLERTAVEQICVILHGSSCALKV